MPHQESCLALLSGTLPLEVVSGRGCVLTDARGRPILDFLGGWCVGTLGWGDQTIAEAIAKQAEQSLYVPPNLRWRGWEELAHLLTELAPWSLTRAYRCCSGSEAVEFALKCARATTGRPLIVSVQGVYHGHTYGAASVGNACSKAMQPCAPGFRKIPLPRTPAEADVSLEALAVLLQGGQVAAYLSEPVWSNAGVFLPPEGFSGEVQRLCRKHGALLVMDEVAVGFGRCGRLFASELFDLEPDILCLGKGLTGGYGCLGATLVTEEVYRKSSGKFPDWATFGWTPVNTAAALANIREILRRKLPERAEQMGRWLLQSLEPLQTLPLVQEVRGIGLLLGIELRKGIAMQLQEACLQEGLLLECCDDRTLFLSPPLVLTEEEAGEGVAILQHVLEQASLPLAVGGSSKEEGGALD
jgi:acetylornithine/succinyldiaminopimelate/putrescine aminotransferase